MIKVTFAKAINHMDYQIPTREVCYMSSILLEIQKTVMEYADIMAKISHVEVEVVDENLLKVAGTGTFMSNINEDISKEGYVYKHIMSTGQMKVIYDPGEDELCQNCPKKGICIEEIEVSMPLKLGDTIIGAIGLVGGSKEQKEIILSNEKIYFELLEQIAGFIEVKAAEVMELKKTAALVETLDCIIHQIDRGILVLDHHNRIITANGSAKGKLGGEELEHMVATIEATGDSIDDNNEYVMHIEDKKYYLMGHLHDLDKKYEKYAKVLIFDSSKNFHKKYYENTVMISPMSSSMNIIGTSIQTNYLRSEIRKIAKGKSTVLITGESGTGKEMVATAIWKESDRKDNRFVAINCGAIPEPLLESELFGYVKGAFTGADPNGRIGKFELANKGVILLDEIGDMPLYLQVKLLRVLQERTITRIGSNQVIPIDVRVIAATNKDLKQMMLENKFREDLYYRLNVIPLNIAPLRERKGDISDLVHFFANRYAELFDKKVHGITQEVMEKLCAYPWNGNVRELENTVEFMINMMEEDGSLDIHTLPNNIIGKEDAKEVRTILHSASTITNLKELEKREIRKAIHMYGDTTEGKKRAATELGIGLATLYRKLEEK